jgi:hypothetical protein
MILDILEGDILANANKSDVIIGMNSQLGEVSGIGLPFTWQIQHNKPLILGTVFSFELDVNRNLHMITCHHLGKDGWQAADKYIRFGMDYLWHREGHRSFSMVKIGTGHIGKRDGADVPAIISAIANSHLAVTLYNYRPSEHTMAEAKVVPKPSELVAYRSWNFKEGEIPLLAA